MMRTPFAVYRQIKLAVLWYGKEYIFHRPKINEYNEPTEESQEIQKVDCIYHDSKRAFIELINNDGASVKSKANRGLLCCKDNNLLIKQGDYTIIQERRFYITAVEPVLYVGEVIGYEISLEELVEGSES